MKRLLLSLIALALGVSLAYAQSPVYTKPFGANSANSSGTIAVTNTFQSIWAASVATTGRSDCIIQNNGAASMFLYFGPIASATNATSLTLVAGAIFRCGNNGVIIKDQISITGTATQAFFAIQF
jgi:hypothetical protein